MAVFQDNFADFQKQLSTFSESVVPRKHLRMQQDIILRFYELVTQHNSKMRQHPVDTGWALGNWRITVKASAPTGKLRKRGAAISPRTEGQLMAQMANLKPFQKVWVYNNVPYMGMLEVGSSYSAPDGIVGPALLDIEIFIHQY